ncbi:hypothetical protein BDP27DRAFT_1316474 [Rhodocollybia butyracea]|uniref:Uncharacterized protein n=1 Tax=Rhodocollybia butyracea TaxID=206335 RepID=A0A9P5Q3V4_9AGAR|nr:hypothetical protein BDP27DRAFT_1316474 [Rhodocollybia butyracea]
MQPAHKTKHLTTLEYPFSTSSTRYAFHLSQTQSLTSHVSGLNSESALSTTNSTNGTTGTTLWLGAQCLAVYLAQHHKPLSAKSNAEPLQAIELGSGIGLCSLVLSALGYSTVYATDTRLVIDSNWTGMFRLEIGIGTMKMPSPAFLQRNQKPLNRLLCLNSTSLLLPIQYMMSLLFSLFYGLYMHCLPSHSRFRRRICFIRSSAPLVFLALERRDPAFIDSFLASAYQWGFDTQQIPKRKLSKVLQKYAENWNRDRDEWDGVEIWKLVLKSNRIAENTLSTTVEI